MSKSKLWGGRFSKKTNALVEDFTRSIQFDKKLAKYDCIGSLAHIDILKVAGLLSETEHNKLKKGLHKILGNIEKISVSPDQAFEDIHSYVQFLLEQDKSVGAAALKLHTCRSRNDQVAFDVKLYCLQNIAVTRAIVFELIDSLKKLGDKNSDVFLPGYTHLQHAIPVALVDHLGAYVAMLTRDNNRLNQISENIKLTFGAGAVAGTFIPAEKYSLSAKGMLPKNVEPCANSIDSVSDRDFVIEILSALSIMAMHVSRLSEDMILWASKEFDFVDIDDAFCTGSSLMPQKKNPDVLELARGYTGRIYGNLINVLVMMKGLPLSYNRDMQHDKEPLFDSFDIMQKTAAVLAELFKNVTFKTANIKNQLDDESLYATDLADYLVQKGVAFKEAHSIIGRLIKHKCETGEDIKTMGNNTLAQFHKFLTVGTVKNILDPKVSVNAKKSIRRTK